ncbi:MAG: nucleoside phosphorylase [Cyclobacteriaceae bacterium]
MAKIPESELILNKDGSIYHLNLKPEHISEYILLVGDPGRVHRISQFFDGVDFEMNKREFITHIGKYNGKRITVMSTGMGTDNSEIAMLELDALANIDLKTRESKSRKKKLKIIRIGTSGSIQEDIRIGSHVISEFGLGMDNLMAYYDLPQTEFELSYSQTLRDYLGVTFTPYTVAGSSSLMEQVGGDMIKGFTATTPGFYAPQGRALRVPIRYPKLVDRLVSFHHHDYWVTNFEMETAGLYALGRLLGHEVISANAILANRSRGTFSKDPHKVVDSLIKKVLDLL